MSKRYRLIFIFMKSVVWRYLQKMRLERSILLFLVLLQPYSFLLFYHRKYRNKGCYGLCMYYIDYSQKIVADIKYYFLCSFRIILEAAYSLYDKAFFDNLPTILIMAVIVSISLHYNMIEFPQN